MMPDAYQLCSAAMGAQRDGATDRAPAGRTTVAFDHPTFTGRRTASACSAQLIACYLDREPRGRRTKIDDDPGDGNSKEYT
jgi:hypothetical protein